MHTCSLSSLTTLRGQEGIIHAATTALRSPHIVCAKFHVEVSTPSVPDSQVSSSPTAEQWRDPWSGGSLPRENDGGLWGKRESKESIKHRGSVAEGDRSRGSSIPREEQHEHRAPEHRNETLWNEINAGDGTQGIWLVLDTLNEFGTWSGPLTSVVSDIFLFCQRSHTFYEYYTDSAQTLSALP